MKKVVLGAMLCGGLWGYDSIDEALENGILSGDITLYGSYTNGTKNQGGNKGKNDFSEFGYMVGSVGLAYHSAFYKYLRVAVSFRAVGVLYENDTDSIWGAGNSY